MTSQVEKFLKFDILSLCHSREQISNPAIVDNIVDTKNRLDSSVGGDTCPSQFVKPPANLVVLEGDC